MSKFLVTATTHSSFSVDTSDPDFLEWIRDNWEGPPDEDAVGTYVTELIENGEHRWDDPEVEVKPDLSK